MTNNNIKLGKILHKLPNTKYNIKLIQAFYTEFHTTND